MRKISSSSFINDQQLRHDCSLACTIGIIGSKWKPTILWHLQTGSLRFSALRNEMPLASERILISHLKELERDKLIERISYPEIPPGVEYKISPLGETIVPLLKEMEQWGILHKKSLGTGWHHGCAINCRRFYI